MAGCKEADDRTDVVLRPLREYSAQIKLQFVRATGPRVSLKFYITTPVSNLQIGDINILNYPGSLGALSSSSRHLLEIKSIPLVVLDK